MTNMETKIISEMEEEKDQEENEEREKDKNKLDILEGIKFWRNRIFFDTPLKYIMIPIFFLNFMLEFYLVGMPYILDGTFLRFLMYVSVFSYCVYLGARIPYKFDNLITSNKKILSLQKVEVDEDHIKRVENTYDTFVDYIRQTFSWRIEFWGGIIFALGFFFMDLYYFGFRTNFAYRMVAGERVYYSPQDIPLSILWVFDTALVFFFIAIITVSTLFMIIATFMCINKLGSEEYPLNVKYADLKIGAFNEIGQFILSLTIPTIVVFTSFSIIGLIQVFIFREAFVGFVVVAIGSMGILAMAVLLYMNTIHIHEAITDFKDKLKNSLINQVQDMLLDEIDRDFNKIQKIHAFYERVESINDWPFNPASIKKLTITLGSSVLPLVLSIFGISL